MRNLSHEPHKQAQNWGLSVLRQFLATGATWEESLGTDSIGSDSLKHLAHCWEDEGCMLVRELVYATKLYSRSEYWIFYKQKLADLGITPEEFEQD